MGSSLSLLLCGLETSLFPCVPVPSLLFQTLFKKAAEMLGPVVVERGTPPPDLSCSTNAVNLGVKFILLLCFVAMVVLPKGVACIFWGSLEAFTEVDGHVTCG